MGVTLGTICQLELRSRQDGVAQGMQNQREDNAQ